MTALKRWYSQKKKLKKCVHTINLMGHEHLYVNSSLTVANKEALYIVKLLKF